MYVGRPTEGPKRDCKWRLDCPGRAYAAGFRRIGIGALFGLAAWRSEAMALAAHLEYLLKRCWQSALTVSLPRLRPAAGAFVPPFSLGDRAPAPLICAFRIVFPPVGIGLATPGPAPPLVRPMSHTTAGDEQVGELVLNAIKVLPNKSGPAR